VTVDGTLTSNGNGVGGVVFFLGLFGSAPTYNLENSASTDTLFSYVGPATFPASASFDAAFTASRLVSAAVQAEYIGSDLNNQGRLQVGNLATGNYFAEIPATSAVGLLSLRDNSQHRLCEGAYIRWKPADDTVDDFCNLSSGRGGGAIQIHFTGVPNNTATLRFRCTLNYECIPSSDTYSFQQTEASPVDLTAYQQAREIISNVPSISWWTTVADSLTTVSSVGSAAALTAANYLIGRAQQRRLQRVLPI